VIPHGTSRFECYERVFTYFVHFELMLTKVHSFFISRLRRLRLVDTISYDVFFTNDYSSFKIDSSRIDIYLVQLFGGYRSAVSIFSATISRPSRIGSKADKWINKNEVEKRWRNCEMEKRRKEEI